MARATKLWVPIGNLPCQEAGSCALSQSPELIGARTWTKKINFFSMIPGD